MIFIFVWSYNIKYIGYSVVDLLFEKRGCQYIPEKNNYTTDCAASGILVLMLIFAFDVILYILYIGFKKGICPFIKKNVDTFNIEMGKVED